MTTIGTPWPRPDKWAAFWLSLLWPGLGQLRAGRWSSLAYFGALAGSVALLPRSTSWAAVAALGLVAAEHAKRCVEADRRKGRATAPAKVRARVVDRSGRGRGRRVSLRIEVEVDRPVAEVWDRVADFEEFVTVDPFHSRAVVLGSELRPGVELALEHRAFGLRFFRFGRLLSWREGRGYAFSDLSGRAGARGFFPHVFDFSVEPGSTGSTRLVVAIRGRWTTRLVPRLVGLWWFRYVCREHARLLQGALT